MEEEMRRREEGQEPSVLELLLSPEAAAATKAAPTRKVKLKRLSKALGREVAFTLRGLPYGKVQELGRLQEDQEVAILLAGCQEPDLKDPRLMELYGGVTPGEMLKAMLLPGEIADLSREVERLCGYRMSTIETVKNG